MKSTSKEGSREPVVANEVPVLVYVIYGASSTSASVLRSGVKACSRGERGSELIESSEEFEWDV